MFFTYANIHKNFNELKNVLTACGLCLMGKLLMKQGPIVVRGNVFCKSKMVIFVIFGELIGKNLRIYFKVVKFIPFI